MPAVLEADGVRLEVPVPDGWSVEPFGDAALALREPTGGAGFRGNVVVRAHRLRRSIEPTGLLDVAADLLDVAADALDQPDAALECRGAVVLDVAGASAQAGLVVFDARPPDGAAVLRLAQLHAFVVPDRADGGEPDPDRPLVVFQLVATGLLDTIDRDAETYGAIVRGLALTSAAAHRGTRAAPR